MTLSADDRDLIGRLYLAEARMLAAFKTSQTACAAYGTARVILGASSATTRKALADAKAAHRADEEATSAWTALHFECTLRKLPGPYTALSIDERDALRVGASDIAA